MHLKNLQQRFVSSLLCDEIDPVFLNELHCNPENQLKCYRNNTRYGLIKSLSQVYPVCQRLVGETFFRQMAYHYVCKEHSSSFSLNDYGGNFKDFIATFPPAQELFYLSWVAALEWQIHRVLLGPENSEFDFAGLSRLQTEFSGHQRPEQNHLNQNLIDQNLNQLQFCLAENGVLFESPFPVHQIWETNQDNYVGETTVDLNEGGCLLFIFRKNLTLHLESLTETEWQWMKAIESGMCLGELHQKWVWEEKDSTEMLIGFIKRGLITRLIAKQITKLPLPLR